jgi:hypothetical protein
MITQTTTVHCLTLNRRLDHNFGSDVVSHKGWIAPYSFHRCLHPHPWANGQPCPVLAGQIHSRKTHAPVCLQHTQYGGLCRVTHNIKQFQFTGDSRVRTVTQLYVTKQIHITNYMWLILWTVCLPCILQAILNATTEERRTIISTTQTSSTIKQQSPISNKLNKFNSVDLPVLHFEHQNLLWHQITTSIIRKKETKKKIKKERKKPVQQLLG